jgi:phospholipid/cholesterol/gamma-HCH transport system permease protein
MDSGVTANTDLLPAGRELKTRPTTGLTMPLNATTLSDPIAFLGRTVIEHIRRLGHFGIFLIKGTANIFVWPPQLPKIVSQVYFIGVKSVLVIFFIAMFTGMVLGLQGYYTLVKFGAEGMLGAAVALSLIRELGPVLTAIMIIGRAGSAMSAEIGIMRISEQIDALFTMNVNPIRFLFSPRLVASLVIFPLLTAFFNVIGILGGYLTGVLLLGINSGTYFHRIESSVTMNDINTCFMKSFVFAALVATICCYQGYYTHLRGGGFGAKGVSLATTSAVVYSCVFVLIADYVITSFYL